MDSEKISPRAIAVAVGCFLGTVLLWAFNGSFSVFLLPISKEFGWGRSVFSSAFMLSTWMTVLCIPLYGRLVDRYGATRVLVPGLILRGFAFASMSLVSGSIPQLFLLFAIFGVGAGLSGYVAYARLIVGWFPKHQGTALGLTLGLGTAIGATCAPLLTNFFIKSFGWRIAYDLIGLPFIVIGVPAALLLLREPPAAAQATQQTQSATPQGLTMHEVVRSGPFWIVVSSFVIFALGWDAIKEHLVAIMHDRGRAALGVVILSTIAMASSIGRVVESLVLDRVRSPKIAVPAFVLNLIGASIIIWGPPDAVLFGAVIAGLGVGGENSILPFFAARYFGMRSYATVLGLFQSCSYFALGVGPAVMAGVFDMAGSYDVGFICATAMIGVGAVLMALLPPYRYPVNRTRQPSQQSEKTALAPSGQ